MQKISVSLLFLIATASNAFAQAAAPAAQPGFGDALSSMVPMFGMVFLIFYFLVFRPQQKKIKDHQAMVDNLKKGELVVTSSGMIGKIAAIEKDAIVVEIASNVKVRFERSHIAKKFDPAAQANVAGVATTATASEVSK